MSFMENKSAKELRDDYLRGDNEWRVELMFPINKIVEFIANRNKSKPRTKLEWIYDGCDCLPEDGSRSVPYCEEHYNPLILKEGVL